MNSLDKVRHSKYIKTAIQIVVVVGLVLFFFFGLQLILGTSTPVRVVISGSMCLPYDGACDGLTHPFTPTLHKGDLIVIQHVDPEDYNTNYPNSDIIVYHDPTASATKTPIVHRIVTSYTENGTIYFQTKGDGNANEPWPNPVPSSDYDSNTGVWDTPTGKGVPGDLVEGKVIMRIPYFGWVTILSQDYPFFIPIVIAVIIVLLIIELVVGGKKLKTEPNTIQT